MYFSHTSHTSFAITAEKNTTGHSSIETSYSPKKILINSEAQIIYSISDYSPFLVILNETDNKIISNITLNEYPEGIVLNSFANTLYVYYTYSKNMTLIDTKTNKIKSHTTLDGDIELALTGLNNKLYMIEGDTSYGKNFSIIDSLNNKKITSHPLPLLNYPDYMAFNPETNTVYLLENANLYEIDGNDGNIIRTSELPSGSDRILIDPPTNRALLVNMDGNRIFILDTKTNQMIKTILINGFNGVEDVSLNPINHKLYIAYSLSNIVEVIDYDKINDNDDATIIDPQKINIANPGSIAINSNNNRVYIDAGDQSNLAVIDANTNNILRYEFKPTSDVTYNPLEGEQPNYLSTGIKVDSFPKN